MLNVDDSAVRRVELRKTFGVDAALYDRARPRYPEQLFNDLSELACLQEPCRVLEIGPGTGQATLALASRGCHVTAVELSPSLANLTRRNLGRYPSVRVVTGAFEAWPLPEEPFDTVVAATAFHWLDPEVRVSKSADALRVGGTLATITTSHVAGGTAAFFVEVQACYERWDPSMPPGLTLPNSADIPYESPELGETARFGSPTFRRYEWDETYSTREYVDLLRTYSGHISLPAEQQQRLFECIGDLIDTRYDGRVTKRYLAELCVARRER